MTDFEDAQEELSMRGMKLESTHKSFKSSLAFDDRPSTKYVDQLKGFMNLQIAHP